MPLHCEGWIKQNLCKIFESLYNVNSKGTTGFCRQLWQVLLFHLKDDFVFQFKFKDQSVGIIQSVCHFIGYRRTKFSLPKLRCKFFNKERAHRTECLTLASNPKQIFPTFLLICLPTFCTYLIYILVPEYKPIYLVIFYALAAKLFEGKV